MPKPSELDLLTAAAVTVPSSIIVPVSDGQSALESKGMTMEQLGIASEYRTITVSSHGLTSDSEGKPLYRVTVWDDTVINTFPMWILINVIDSNTLLVAGNASLVELPVSLLQNGASYNPVTSGYALWWDKSASGTGMYNGSKASDAQDTADPVLLFVSVGVSTFKAIVSSKAGLPDTNTRIVRGTGVAAVDTAAFAAAKTAVEALGYGAIGISGNVVINSTQNFTQPISLFGVQGTDPEITLSGDVMIAYNNSYSPHGLSSTAIEATAAKQAYIKVATGTLSAGDWFFAMSDDTIDGCTHSNDNLSLNLTSCTADATTDKITKSSHGLSNNVAVVFYDVGASNLTRGRTYWVVNKTTNDFQVALTRAGSAIDITSGGTVSLRSIYANCPMEMHQVKEIRESTGGYDYIVFDDFIVDALVTNPRIVKCTSPTDGVTVRDIKFSWTGSTAPTNSALAFNKCINTRVLNCTWAYNGPNEIWVVYCARTLISGCQFGPLRGYNSSDGYAVIIGTVNGFLFTDSETMGCRHTITTTAGVSNGARYCTPRNVLISNIVARMNGRTDTSLHTFDTHAEGWGIVFEGCVVHVPYDPRNPSAGSPTKNTNAGFQSRSRHTIFRNCHVFGSGETTGFRILADDCHVEYCTVEGGWRGIVVQEESGGLSGYTDRAVLVHNTIRNLSGTAGGCGVLLQNGNTHRVAHNDFDNVAGTASYSGTDPGCVCIREGTGHKIINNAMHKVSNKYSIAGTGFASADVTIRGNVMTGYTGVSGSTDSGIMSSNADSVALQAQCDTYNWTD